MLLESRSLQFQLEQNQLILLPIDLVGKSRKEIALDFLVRRVRGRYPQLATAKNDC